MVELSEQSKQILEQRFALRQTLKQVLPLDLVDYILTLLVLDASHKKFLNLSEEKSSI